MTGGVLAYGEHLIWQLWAWLRRGLGLRTVGLWIPLVGPRTPLWFATTNLRPVIVDRNVQRRGPPRFQVWQLASR